MTATEKCQRPVFALGAEIDIPSDDDEVVTTVDNSVERALEISERFVENGHAGGAVTRLHRGEMGMGLGGERPADLRLVLGQDVDRERLRLLDHRPYHRHLMDAEQDVWRFL